MIIDIEGNEVSANGYIPHRKQWDACVKNLNLSELQEIKDAFNKKVDEILNSDNANVIEAAWVTGSDWRKTAFLPLYYAAKESSETAGYFAGLMLWQVLAERDDVWVLWRDPNREVRQYFLRT